MGKRLNAGTRGKYRGTRGREGWETRQRTAGEDRPRTEDEADQNGGRWEREAERQRTRGRGRQRTRGSGMAADERQRAVVDEMKRDGT